MAPCLICMVMYGIFTYIWVIFRANVGKYSIHGAYGICTCYPPAMTNIYCNSWFSSLWKVTFHSYVNVYQRVNPLNSHQTTIFLWFSYGFPIVFGDLHFPKPQKYHQKMLIEWFRSNDLEKSANGWMATEWKPWVLTSRWLKNVVIFEITKNWGRKRMYQSVYIYIHIWSHMYIYIYIYT